MDDVPLTFGKYKGSTPNEVGDKDPSYIVWMYETIRPVKCSKDLYESCEWDVREMEAEAYQDWLDDCRGR